MDVNRPRSVSEHVATVESESGRLSEIYVRAAQRNIASRRNEFTPPRITRVGDADASPDYDRLAEKRYEI